MKNKAEGKYLFSGLPAVHFEDGRVIHPLNVGGVLSHSRSKLPGPLSRLPDSFACQAMSIHRNILGWMGDRPLVESKRMPLAYSIVFKDKGEPLLRSEIFLQLTAYSFERNFKSIFKRNLSPRRRLSEP